VTVRAFPGLHAGQLAGPPRRSTPCLREGSTLTHLGRTAIVQALRAFGIGHGCDVLVPAFHCGVEVEAVRHTGATPRFYPVPPSLLVAPGEIQARLTPTTRAVLVIHFFGVRQDVGAVNAICSARGIRVIEDCAHVFPCDAPGFSSNSGDAAVYSLPKFFPVPDGGVLRFRSGERLSGGLPTLEAPPRIPIARRAARLLLDGFSARHPATGAVVDRVLLDPVRRATRPPHDGGSVDGLRSGYNPAASTFDPAVALAAASNLTRRVLERVDAPAVAAARRRNHEHLAARIQDIPGLEVVPLPPASVPLVLAVRVHARAMLEVRLRERGVETFRFGAQLSPLLNADERASAMTTAEPLLGLPVHQDLQPKDVDKVARALEACFG